LWISFANQTEILRGVDCELIAETHSFAYLWITFTILYFLNRDGGMKGSRLIAFQGNKKAL